MRIYIRQYQVPSSDLPLKSAAESKARTKVYLEPPRLIAPPGAPDLATLIAALSSSTVMFTPYFFAKELFILIVLIKRI